MYALFLFLLIPILIILVFLLGLGIFAYAKLAALWYRLTGKQPKNPFSTWTSGSQFDSGNGYQQSGYESSSHFRSAEFGSRTQQQSKSANAQNGKKIFSDKDGEYVDFEVVD